MQLSLGSQMIRKIGIKELSWVWVRTFDYTTSFIPKKDFRKAETCIVQVFLCEWVVRVLESMEKGVKLRLGDPEA